MNQGHGFDDSPNIKVHIFNYIKKIKIRINDETLFCPAKVVRAVKHHFICIYAICHTHSDNYDRLT